MPREVKAYSCVHDCRRRVLTSKSAMAKHEKTCAKNPERRACTTCEHKIHLRLPTERAGVIQVEPGCDVGRLPYGASLNVDCEGWAPLKRAGMRMVSADAIVCRIQTLAGRGGSD